MAQQELHKGLNKIKIFHRSFLFFAGFSLIYSTLAFFVQDTSFLVETISKYLFFCQIPILIIYVFSPGKLLEQPYIKFRKSPKSITIYRDETLFLLLGGLLFFFFINLIRILQTDLPYPDLMQTIPALNISLAGMIILLVQLREYVLFSRKNILFFLLDFSFTKHVSEFYRNHKIWIDCYIATMLLLVLIFGAKLLYISYSTDDYARLLGAREGFFLTKVSGRWGGDLFNTFLFQGDLHILPYLNSLISLFFFSACGIITVRIWGLKDRVLIIFGSLLCIVTPYLAHNLYFNTNTSVSFVFFLTILSFHTFLKDRRYAIFLIICLTLAISTYQTIIQIYIVILLGYILKKLLEDNGNEEKIAYYFEVALHSLIVLATCYFLANYIADTIIGYMGLEKGGRFADAAGVDKIKDNINRIFGIYKNLASDHGYLYFSDAFIKQHFAYIMLVILALFYCMFGYRRNAWKIPAITIIVLALPLVIHLPNLIGLDIPMRAHMTIGWSFSLIICVLLPHIPILKVVSSILGITSILISTLYINVFFYNAHRQTDLDITIARDIVGRIRNHPKYRSEPVTLYLIGRRNFHIDGWNWKQNAFYAPWSKYAIINHFTDLKFHVPSEEQEQKVSKELAEISRKSRYPHNGSILFLDNRVVAVLLSNY